MDLSLIKYYAERHKISIRKLASLTGMSEVNIHKNVRLNSIAALNLEKIAQVLGEPIENFFDESVRRPVVDSHAAIASGKDAKAEANDYRGAKIVGAKDADARISVLEEKIELLTRQLETQRQLIAEKERTIGLLLATRGGDDSGLHATGASKPRT